MPSLRRRVTRAAAGLLPALLLATTAHAVRPSTEVPERTHERAAGRARAGTRTATVAPAAARPAFDAFLARRGAWKAIWDADRAIPISLWGEGIAVPGSTRDAAIAEDAARRVLADELALLAPGAVPGDFVVERNHLRAGIRSVWFRQHHGGLPVVGGQVGFSFKDDTLLVMRSTAAPHLAAAAPARPVARDDAERRAAAWIEDLYGAPPAVLRTGAAVVLATTLDDGTLDARVVLPVTVDLARPRAQWTVWVDAGTGKPVARRQQLLFGQGTLRYQVPDRYPAGDRSGYAAAFANHMADGIPATSDVAGLFSWVGAAAATVAPGLIGTYASVVNTDGALATDSLAVSDGGDAIWDRSAEERIDAQLVSFVHATIAKRYAIDTLDPDLPWLHQSMQVVVNEPDICNAYSMLDDIHFFVLGSFGPTTCDNTARLPDIVYHEFGHSLHGQGSGQTDFQVWNDAMFALSEGTSDYYAITITGDPAMGPGFFLDDPSPLRHLDPEGIEKVYPTDLVGESHADGEIIAGALWDLRKALVAELGESAGVALADDIYYGVIVNAPDMTAAYAEALLVDDDDADLSNGTPHQCTIQGAFDLHGLGDGASILAALEPPAVDGLTLTLDKPEVSGGGGGGCTAIGISAVTAFYRLRGDGVFQSVPFVEGTDAYTVTLPIDTENEVVEYRVEVLLDGGAVRGFPDHDVEPWYELFNGQVTEIYCTDFETDPGWTLDPGWARGAPAGEADPTAAFSGTNVLGTYLGDTGQYLPDALIRALGPEIDVTGYDVVRLQFRRWLTVERSGFDAARIFVDGVALWTNDPLGDHLDREWLWRDLDLTPLTSDGRVRIELVLDPDGTFEYGGWNLDDFCVVGVGPPPVTADGEPVPPEGDGGCCSTGRGGATGPIVLALLTLAGLLRWRRGERGTGASVR